VHAAGPHPRTLPARPAKDFKHRVRELTGRSWGVSMRHRLEALAQCLRGWMGYFGISQYYRPIPELDEWLRRRVRMCYWKQWRLPRTKVRHLLALGVERRSAIATALSGKSYWHLSRCLVTPVGMTVEWLKRQGLLSIRELWMTTQGYVCGFACAAVREPPGADPHAVVVWGGWARNPPLPDWTADYSRFGQRQYRPRPSTRRPHSSQLPTMHPSFQPTTYIAKPQPSVHNTPVRGLESVATVRNVRRPGGNGDA
jgi:hypothetical protein